MAFFNLSPEEHRKFIAEGMANNYNLQVKPEELIWVISRNPTEVGVKFDVGKGEIKPANAEKLPTPTPADKKEEEVGGAADTNAATPATPAKTDETDKTAPTTPKADTGAASETAADAGAGAGTESTIFPKTTPETAGLTTADNTSGDAATGTVEVPII